MKQIIFVNDHYSVRRWRWKGFKWTYLSKYGEWDNYPGNLMKFESSLLAEEYVNSRIIRPIKFI